MDFTLKADKQKLQVVVPTENARIVRIAAEYLADLLNDNGMVEAKVVETDAAPEENEIVVASARGAAVPNLEKDHYRIDIIDGKVTVFGENDVALAGGINTITEAYRKALSKKTNVVIEPKDELFVPKERDYKLVWHDEFDAPELNRRLWVSQSRPYRTPSCLKTDCYGVKAINAEIKDGKASIYAYRDPKTDNFYHGQICTKGTHRFLYGCMEMRVKLSVLPGANALWFVSHYPGNGKDKNAEIDLLEDFKWENEFNANVHRWGKNFEKDTGREKSHYSLDWLPEYSKAKHYTRPKDMECLRGTWHLYTLEWTPEKLRFCLDGKPFFSYDIDHDIDGYGTALYHYPLYTLISTTMGPNWYSAPWEEGDPDKVDIQVDYIRLYQRDCDDGYSLETWKEEPEILTLEKDLPKPGDPNYHT